MKTKDWFKNMLDEFHEDSDFRLETLILNLTERICEIMEQKAVDNTGLSELLNIPKPAVTEMLDGNSNFTLEKLLSLADALDHDLEISFRERKRNVVELRPILDKRIRSDEKRMKPEPKSVYLNNISQTAVVPDEIMARFGPEERLAGLDLEEIEAYLRKIRQKGQIEKFSSAP